ncbi:hypothetical protein PENTCL1PPCAC_23216, partial [Pristionchus entomophagus]
KKLKNSSIAGKKGQYNFLTEACVLRKLDHPHIVQIIGTSHLETPLLIVMEYCNGGSMSSYLMKNGKTMEIKEKSRFVVEAAEGMAYLERQLCVHRAISAKKCLLSGTNKTVKISGFRLSHDNPIIFDPLFSQIPEWKSPEILMDSIYSLKSDVWDFAMLMWEIYSNGAEPYPGLTRLLT